MPKVILGVLKSLSWGQFRRHEEGEKRSHFSDRPIITKSDHLVWSIVEEFRPSRDSKKVAWLYKKRVMKDVWVYFFKRYTRCAQKVWEQRYSLIPNEHVSIPKLELMHEPPQAEWNSSRISQLCRGGLASYTLSAAIYMPILRLER